MHDKAPVVQTQSFSLIIIIICWTVIYPVDRATQHLDMGGQIAVTPELPSMPLNLKFVMGNLRPKMAVAFTGISWSCPELF